MKAYWAQTFLCFLALFVFLPAVAPAQMANEKSSPFEALRWNGDSPEVMVQSTWYRPITIHGVEIDAIVTYCNQEYGRRAKKRFGEDLPVVLQRMGHPLPAAVNLTLIRISDGSEVTLTNVPSTRHNRNAIWQSNQKANGNDRPARKRQSQTHLSREKALADLAEFEQRLDDQFAYRHWKGIDLSAQLDTIRSSLKDQVKIEDLNLQLHLLMMTFGNGHAGARSRHAMRSERYPPFLLADASNGGGRFQTRSI